MVARNAYCILTVITDRASGVEGARGLGPSTPLRPPEPTQTNLAFPYEGGLFANSVVSYILHRRSNVDDHPWKVSDNGDGTVAVAAGVMFDVVSSRLPSSGQDGSDFVMNPLVYAGTSSLSITSGTRYIYAKVGIDFARDPTYESTVVPDSGGSPLTNSTTFAFDFADAATITVYESANAPTAEGTSGGGQWIVPIAKVTRSGSTTTVDVQYLTHNPMLQLTGHELQ